MNAFFSYIFRHSWYKEVMDLYNQAITKYDAALKIWEDKVGLADTRSFASKEFIATNINDIKEVEKWLKRYNRIKTTHNGGLIWIFKEKGMPGVPAIGYDELKFIYGELSKVEELQGYLKNYEELKRNDSEAINRFLGISKNNHTYDEIKRIALSKCEIKKISEVIRNAHFCEINFAEAWKLFSAGRRFNDIPMPELQSITKDTFETKERFLKIYQKEPSLLSLIFGSSLHPIDSFEKEAIEQEEDLTIILASRNIESIEPFNGVVHLDNEKELKRAILDSEKYGVACNFADSFTIDKFYRLRADFDRIGVPFDDAVIKAKSNDDAIKAYNYANSGQRQSYIEDYLRCVTDGSPLYQFIEAYKDEQNKRAEAKRIQRTYPRGVDAILGAINLDTCILQDVIKLINSKDRIVSKDNELKVIERKRIEAELKRQKEERKRQEIGDLKACVSSWPQPRRSCVDCFSLYNYYPTTCDWNASEDEWDIRNLIWDFKANPNRPQSEAEIIRSHRRALNEVLPDLKRVISHFFGSNKSKLTLVCIPSSKRHVSERRYKDLSEELCNETGMSNGYSHVHVVSEGEATHLGGTELAKFSIDREYFNDRYVLLFDDVITSGASMERFKSLLESAGATVIGGLSIGKTKHERQLSNPIDEI